MNLLKSIPFTVGNKDYEVRVHSDSTNLSAQAFCDGKPCSFCYVINFNHAMKFKEDFFNANGFFVEPMNVLVEDAKQDVVQKKWETFSHKWQAFVKLEEK